MGAERQRERYGMMRWTERRNLRTPTKYGHLGGVESLGGKKNPRKEPRFGCREDGLGTATLVPCRNGGGARNRRRPDGNSISRAEKRLERAQEEGDGMEEEGPGGREEGCIGMAPL